MNPKVSVKTESERFYVVSFLSARVESSFKARKELVIYCFESLFYFNVFSWAHSLRNVQAHQKVLFAA